MAQSEIEFAVQMKCDSCVKAVEKVLNDEKIDSFKIDFNRGSVVVNTSLPTQTVQEKLESTGRKVVIRGYAGSLAGVSILDTGNTNVQGVVRFVQATPNLCIIDGTIDGLDPNTDYKLNIYECGDLSQGCQSVGDVYHASHQTVKSSNHGRATFKMEDPQLKLSDMIGRSLVVNDGSKKVVCGIIARSAGLFQNPKTICACDGLTIWDEKIPPKSAL